MKVALIDDHPLVLEGLAAVLSNEEGFAFVGQATDGKEAVRLVSEERPDLIIMDVRLGKENGLDIIEKIRRLDINCRFAVLTSCSDLETFKRANELCVDGFISKQALPEEFLAAIRMIKRGRKFFDPEIVAAFMTKETNDPFNELTSREREVLYYLGKGLNNRGIAAKLYVTEHTVKKHVGQILGKLNVNDRTQAALFAVNNECVLAAE